MSRILHVGTGAALAVLILGTAGAVQAQSSSMSFFVTSAGSGKGADFGGLAGADKHCQSLAAAAGAGGKTWHAYLSTQAAGSTAAVNAKDRIGKGPWQNAKGVVVAKDVAELHGNNNLTKQTALTEKGDVVNGRGDTAEQARHSDGHPSPTARRSPRARTRPAATGRKAERDPRSSGTRIARDSTRPRRRFRGIRRTRRQGAAIRRWYRPEAPGFSIASRRTDGVKNGAGDFSPAPFYSPPALMFSPAQPSACDAAKR